MNYTIKMGSQIVAKRHDGTLEAKTIQKPRMYHSAELDEEHSMYSFEVGPGSLYASLHARQEDVIVNPDITSIPDGTYSVVRGNSYATIKLETQDNELTEQGKKNFFYGKQIVKFLSGPDNLNNFTGFAHLDEQGALRVWKSFKKDGSITKYQEALNFLQSHGEEALRAGGLMYALKSGRCCKCNRKLTVPASVHQGMGPICSKGGIDA